MIDYISVPKNWVNAVQQCRIFPSADIPSDHTLVLCNMSIQLKIKIQRKQGAIVQRNNWDFDKLRDATTQLFYRGKVVAFIKERKLKIYAIRTNWRTHLVQL